MKVQRRPAGIFLSQRPFAQNIVELAGITNAKPTDPPLPLSHPLYEERRTPTKKDKEVMRDIPYTKMTVEVLQRLSIDENL